MDCNQAIGMFGGWSGVHVGDDAILLETLRVLNQEIPTARIQLFCSTPDITQSLSADYPQVQVVPALRGFTQEDTDKVLTSKSSFELLFNRISWLLRSSQLYRQCLRQNEQLSQSDKSLYSFIEALHQCKIMVFAGGGYLNSQLRLSWLYPSLLLIKLCEQLNIPVYLCGQTVGPLDSLKDRWLVSKVFQYASLVGSREQETIQLLKELNLEDSVLVREKDAAWGLMYDTSNVGEEFDRSGLEKIAISLQPRGEAEKLLDQELVNRLLHDLPNTELIFFPHAPEDVPYQEALINHLQNSVQEIADRVKIVPLETHPSKNKALVSKCRLCIGTRFHFHVFALSTGTPSISLYKQVKTTGIFKDYGIEALCFNPGDLADPVTDTIGIIKATFAASKEYRTRIEQARSCDSLTSHTSLRQAISAYKGLAN